jgi:hypothetical protein
MLPVKNVIETESSSHEEVLDAGLQLMAVIYGGKPSDDLNHMRYTTYMNLMATSPIQPRPERLPPTQNAAKYHIYWTLFQTAVWKSLGATIYSVTLHGFPVLFHAFSIYLSICL